jgi:hypothetical protein
MALKGVRGAHGGRVHIGGKADPRYDQAFGDGTQGIDVLHDVDSSPPSCGRSVQKHDGPVVDVCGHDVQMSGPPLVESPDGVDGGSGSCKVHPLLNRQVPSDHAEDLCITATHDGNSKVLDYSEALFRESVWLRLIPPKQEGGMMETHHSKVDKKGLVVVIINQSAHIVSVKGVTVTPHLCNVNWHDRQRWGA